MIEMNRREKESVETFEQMLLFSEETSEVLKTRKSKFSAVKKFDQYYRKTNMKFHSIYDCRRWNVIMEIVIIMNARIQTNPIRWRFANG
jgi:hypothetical protein